MEVASLNKEIDRNALAAELQAAGFNCTGVGILTRRNGVLVDSYMLLHGIPDDTAGVTAILDAHNPTQSDITRI